MAERLAELFVEISANNKTGPVFAQIKREMQAMAGETKTLGATTARAVSLPIIDLEKELAKKQAAVEKMIRRAGELYASDKMIEAGPSRVERGIEDALRRHRADLAGQTGPNRVAAAFQQQADEAMRRHRADIAGQSGGVNSVAAGFQQRIAEMRGAFENMRPTAKSINDEVEQLIANYKRAQATAGMTTNQVRLWDLAQRGAKQSHLDILGNLYRQEDAQLRMHKGLMRMNDTWGDLRRNMYVLMYAATGLTGAIGGFVAAASPDIWHTFTGSIKDAAGAIGTAFSPAIIDISYKLQQFADWFDAIDEGTKKSIASWTLWGIGIFAGSVAVVGMLRVLAAVKSMLSVLYAVVEFSVLGFRGLTASIVTATTALRAFVMAHPVGAILSLVAAVGLLAFGFSQVGSSAEGAAGQIEAMEELIASGQSSPENTAVVQRARELERALRESERPGTSPAQWEAMRARALANAGLPAEQGGPSTPLGEAGIRILVARVLGQAVQTPAAQNQMRTDVRFQSRFMSVEDVWKNIQLSATSMTPIEQRALQRHMQQLQVLSIIATNTAPANQAQAVGQAVGAIVNNAAGASA